MTVGPHAKTYKIFMTMLAEYDNMITHSNLTAGFVRAVPQAQLLAKYCPKLGRGEDGATY
jgi:hypothetical protein